VAERTVVITGASSGIGAATALHLDDLGWRVFAGVRRGEDGEALRAKASSRLRPLRIDVTDQATLQTAAADVAETVGAIGLHGLVCNAGVAVGGPLEFVDLDDVRRQLEVNVVGVVATLQAFIPLLRAARGRVVLMGSIGGRMASPFIAPYSASKHALEAIADSLRVELLPWGIGVSILEPGSVATPIWDKATVQSAELTERLPERALRLYGRALARVGPVIEQQQRSGIPPRRVADAVTHALTASRPRTRYLIGRDAMISARVRRLLPDRAWDRVVTRVTGLPRHVEL
jgi:NAD(P)-dependent dehydrogenase (short-subunit alcohol dehydrogenase family)